MGFVMIGVGAFSASCAVANFDWFMNHRKARFIARIFGKNGARIFYVLLGVGLVGLGVGMEAGVIDMSK